jgi:pimeloyl-ACP methyl ester carboxylesterase
VSGPLPLFIDAGGIKTHVYLAGEGGRYPVVFVHGGGLGSDAHSWLGTMSQLARRTYAFDTVGFGRSAAPPQGEGGITYDTATIVKHLRDVLDTLALERVILVGHSLGATTVARFAVTHPDRVAATVMVAPGGGSVGLKYHSDGHAAMARVLNDPSFENVRELAALMRANDDHADEDARKRLDVASAPGILAALRAYAAAAPARSLEDSLPQLLIPLMLMWGTGERFNPAGLGDQIAAKLPNLKQYAVFEGAGHYIQYDAPDRFSATLANFFDDVEVAS